VRADEPLTDLRIAVNTGNGEALVALLESGPWPDNALQLVGDGLIAALGQHIGGAAALAHRCVDLLRERGWTGDEELADQLDGLTGAGATPLLRPLPISPISLEELAGVLEGDPMDGDGRLDLRTGEVWSRPAIEYARESGEEEEDESEDTDRWLWVRNLGSRSGYRDMQEFIETVGDPGRADRLAIAIEGRGAFRRFKDVLARWPGELERYFAFSDERHRGRARAWLADEGYRVSGSAPGP